MAKYQLTENQKEILRAAAKGLREGTVERRWNIYTHGEEWLGNGIEGFPGAIEMELTLTDLRDFKEYGFLRQLNQNRGIFVYEVREQTILDAVDSNFEAPMSVADKPLVQAVFNAPIYGSNVSVAQVMDHYSQSVSLLPNVSNDNKATLEAMITDVKEQLIPFQESHPNEVREVTRSVDLVIGDLTEHPRDKDNLVGAIARLKRAGAKLVFSAMAHSAVKKFAEFIEGLLHVGS